jgi:hypothetical protein
MNEIPWFSGFALGLLANVFAELFLAFDLRRPWHLLDPACRRRRIARWVLCMLGHAGLVIAGASLSTLLLFALFSVSASTDFELSLLPPDAFLYGSVITAIFLAGLTGGWPALRDVAVAQAFCFAVVTLGVAFLNLCDSGDIKLAMQFGALCGSLGAVAAGALGIWIVAAATVVATILLAAWRGPVRLAVQRAIHQRPPQGPLMWAGYLLAMWMTRVMVLP